jgi:hypothetical protein
MSCLNTTKGVVDRTRVNVFRTQRRNNELLLEGGGESPGNATARANLPTNKDIQDHNGKL